MGWRMRSCFLQIGRWAVGTNTSLAISVSSLANFERLCKNQLLTKYRKNSLQSTEQTNKVDQHQLLTADALSTEYCLCKLAFSLPLLEFPRTASPSTSSLGFGEKRLQEKRHVCLRYNFALVTVHFCPHWGILRWGR